MKNKKDGVNKRRGAGKILLATTLAGSAATSAMTQSTSASAGLFDFFKNTKSSITNGLSKVASFARRVPTTILSLISLSITKSKNYLMEKFSNNEGTTSVEEKTIQKNDINTTDNNSVNENISILNQNKKEKSKDDKNINTPRNNAFNNKEDNNENQNNEKEGITENGSSDNINKTFNQGTEEEPKDDQNINTPRNNAFNNKEDNNGNQNNKKENITENVSSNNINNNETLKIDNNEEKVTKHTEYNNEQGYKKLETAIGYTKNDTKNNQNIKNDENNNVNKERYKNKIYEAIYDNNSVNDNNINFRDGYCGPTLYEYEFYESNSIKEGDKEKETYEMDNNNKMSLEKYQKNSKNNNFQEENSISNKELFSSQANIDKGQDVSNTSILEKELKRNGWDKDEED